MKVVVHNVLGFPRNEPTVHSGFIFLFLSYISPVYRRVSLLPAGINNLVSRVRNHITFYIVCYVFGKYVSYKMQLNAQNILPTMRLNFQEKVLKEQ